MKYNPQTHHRRSIRLKEYDYSQNGGYFITICTQDREILLERADVKEMIGNIWLELENKFSGIEVDEFVIMPNHIHGIMFIVVADPCIHSTVGADLRVCPNGNPTLSRIIQWFKTMTTNYYIRNVKEQNWKPFQGRFWQRNYYEHIIRNEGELNKVRQYIIENPLKWEEDENNPKNL